MSKTQPQLDVAAILRELGYSFSESGNDWYRTKALYRDGHGDNLVIHKKSGCWRDFVSNKSGNLKELIRLSNKEIDIENFEDKEDRVKKKRITMEKTFNEKDLEKLLPNYTFYLNKGISEETLKKYRCGVAQEGNQYQRMVFPIFNKNGKIHGYAGRDLLDRENRPKWKFTNPSSKFIYPYYLGKEFQDLDDVFLIESIGDSLAMTEYGIKNHLVTFGLNLSSCLLSHLLAISPKKIFISLNDDREKKGETEGLVHVINMYLKLLNYFPLDTLNILLPIRNDFGDMDQKDFDAFKIKASKVNKEKQVRFILSFEDYFNRNFSGRFKNSFNKIRFSLDG